MKREERWKVVTRKRYRYGRAFTQYVPILVMLARWYGTIDFHTNPREIFLVYEGNEPPVYFFYIVTYVILPITLWDRSRLYKLCWRWRIPLYYCIGINIEHLLYGSIIITNEMEAFDYSLIILTILFYAYGFITFFYSKRIGNYCKTD